jgi:hypothetical protein
MERDGQKCCLAASELEAGLLDGMRIMTVNLGQDTLDHGVGAACPDPLRNTRPENKQCLYQEQLFSRLNSLPNLPLTRIVQESPGQYRVAWPESTLCACVAPSRCFQPGDCLYQNA